MDVSSSGLPASVALLETGPMGAPIAQNILAGGVPLTLWNRTAHKAAEIAGGQVAASPAEAASEVVLTVLPDLPDVARLLAGTDGLLAGDMARIRQPVLVIHGTVLPSPSRRSPPSAGGTTASPSSTHLSAAAQSGPKKAG